MGEYQHNIDKKGRVIVPSKFREELGNIMIVTRWLDGCLGIFTQDQWESIFERIKALPMTKRESRVFIHMVTAKATECELDGQGRILIPASLIREADLVKECVFVGVNDHVELWNNEKWNHYYDQASENFEEIAEQLTEFF